ncbi:type VII secretion target [Symbioplanes lichenis]|uniref:type VII secretion target n=1 Tax=Symbioplanes lichenis TaxID=1629072 RepID=UPI002739071F|nr:type VII secretion target [Actinoplanes lichenis]
MTDEFSVDPGQLLRHADAVDAIRARFLAVRGASAAISADGSAYGMLCGWIAGILEARHAEQDELVAYVEENLSLAAAALRSASSGYEGTDDDISRQIRAAGGLA